MTDGHYQLPLYVSNAEIVERMGVGINSGRKALQKMSQDPKFPPRSIGGKRYWPSVVDFLDVWNGRRVDVRGIPAGQEDHGQTPLMRRARARLAAAEEALGKRVAARLEDDQDLRAPLDKAEVITRPWRRGVIHTPDGHERQAATGAGKVRVTAPDGRKWTEDAKPTDPASWQRKRPFKPWTPPQTE
jgi:hypothetical protein